MINYRSLLYNSSAQVSLTSFVLLTLIPSNKQLLTIFYWPVIDTLLSKSLSFLLHRWLVCLQEFSNFLCKTLFFQKSMLCILKPCINSYYFFTMFTSLQVKYQHVTGLFQNQFKQVILRFKISMCCKINSHKRAPGYWNNVNLFSCSRSNNPIDSCHTGQIIE